VATGASEEIQLIDDDGLSVGSLFAGLRAHWLVLLLATSVGGAGGYALSYLMPLMYRAEALISVNSEDQSGGGLRSLAGSVGALASLAGIGGSTGDQSRSATIAMLTSHAFLQQYIQDKGLLPALYPQRWDAQAKKWITDKLPEPTLQDGADLLLRKVLSVTEDRKTSLITVRAVWTDREHIADWINGVVAAANATARRLAIQRSDDALKNLGAEAPAVESVAVRASLYSLIETQLNRRMLANTRPDYAFQIIDPAQTPRVENRVSPSRMGFAAIGAMLLLMVAGVWAVVRHRQRQTDRAD
jgi:uncharacterized protein involved in exopolysaccharide biosynthesis